MVDNIVICRKLEKMLQYYRELEELTNSLTEHEYLNQLTIRRAVERVIQLIIECAIDINNMILKRLNKGPASDYFNSFIDLAENDIIETSFALEIAPSTGLRNILVHEYEKVDDVIVYHSIRKILSHYRHYLKAISERFDCQL